MYGDSAATSRSSSPMPSMDGTLGLRSSTTHNRLEALIEKSRDVAEEEARSQMPQIFGSNTISDYSTRPVVEHEEQTEEPIIDKKAGTRESWTVQKKMWEFVKNPATELQKWTKGRAKKMENKGDYAAVEEYDCAAFSKRDQRDSFNSCAPPNCSRTYKEIKNVKEAEHAKAMIIKEGGNSSYIRQMVSALKESQRVADQRSLRKGKEKEVASRDNTQETVSKRQQHRNEARDKSSPPAAVIWYPEFQFQPPPNCNYLLLSQAHGFSDSEIQEMLWFIGEVMLGLTSPIDWLIDNTHATRRREAFQWSASHPLGLPEDYPHTFSSPQSPPFRRASWIPKSLNRDWMVIPLPYLAPDLPKLPRHRIPNTSSPRGAIFPSPFVSPSASPTIAGACTSSAPKPPPEMETCASEAVSVYRAPLETPNPELPPLRPIVHLNASASRSTPELSHLPRLRLDTSAPSRIGPGPHVPNNTPQTADSSTSAGMTRPNSEDGTRTSIFLNFAQESEHTKRGTLVDDSESTAVDSQGRKDSGYGLFSSESRMAERRKLGGLRNASPGGE